MPERIQMRRTKGWRKRAGVIYVGRPSKWGNPFVIGGSLQRGDDLWPFIERGRSKTSNRFLASASDETVKILDPTIAVELYADYLAQNSPLRIAALEELAGHDLGCWCPIGAPCHGDYLVDLVNRRSVGAR
jgi:hypothetical protein